MTAISQRQIEKTYELGKNVYLKKIGRMKAIETLSKDLKMNEASAGHYLRAITKMLEGDVFQHNISLQALKTFFENIQNDEALGDKRLDKAVKSVEAHIAYHKKNKHSNKVGFIKLVEQYKNPKAKKARGGDRKFDHILLDQFDALEGAFSIVTQQEAEKGHITTTGSETKIIQNYFGKDNIYRGAKTKAPNPQMAMKTYSLYSETSDYEQIILTTNYPKTDKNELHIYMNKAEGFSPESNEVWFIYRPRDQNSLLTIGFMSEKEWEIIRGETLDNNIAEDFKDDEYFQELLNRGATPKELKELKSKKYPRDLATAKRSLKAASYLCELDTNHVTFKSHATDKNYVEAHHLIPLCKHTLFKDKSVDVPGNILSLCPNCHRKIHFSKKEELEPMLKILYEKRKENLANCGLEISFEDLLSFYS